MQVFVAALLALSGWPILLGGPRPGSLAAALSPTFVMVWAGTLVAGGVLMVLAAIVRGPLLGVYLELLSAPSLALLLFAYGQAALYAVGTKAIVAVALCLGLAAAFVVRTVQAGRTLRRLRGRE